MEDLKEGFDKKGWFDLIHNCDPSIDWKEIETETAWKKYQKYSDPDYLKTSGPLSLANGSVIGQWEERGSSNQSGSILSAAYDKNEDRLYIISDGGSLWKGRRDGINWQPMNDQLRFDGRFLKTVYTQDGELQLLSSINGIPHHSRDGINWFPAFGVNQAIEKNRDITVLNQGRDIFFVSKLKGTGQVVLFHSQDFGNSYGIKKFFSTNNLNEVALDGKETDNTFYLVEKRSNGSKLSRWDSDSNALVDVVPNCSLQFGINGRANIKVSHPTAGSTYLYAYSQLEGSSLMRSTDLGQTWIELSKLWEYPFEGGVFISEENPNNVFICAINAYRSTNGGLTFDLVNHWEDYYPNILNNLHADIMNYQEFKRGNDYFMTVCTHGGIFTSDDGGFTYANRSTFDLNVSQYYDVKVHPREKLQVFAGSQDQGLQRKIDLREGAQSLNQILTGDFSHITFADDDRRMWCVFPGGTAIHISNPRTFNIEEDAYDQISFGYQEDIVWMPPMIENINMGWR